MIHFSLIDSYISKLKPFIYSSGCAVIYEDKYLIYSHEILIAVIDINSLKVDKFDIKQYSKTATNLQNLLSKRFYGSSIATLRKREGVK